VLSAAAPLLPLPGEPCVRAQRAAPRLNSGVLPGEALPASRASIAFRCARLPRARCSPRATERAILPLRPRRRAGPTAATGRSPSRRRAAAIRRVLQPGAPVPGPGAALSASPGVWPQRRSGPMPGSTRGPHARRGPAGGLTHALRWLTFPHSTREQGAVALVPNRPHGEGQPPDSACRCWVTSRLWRVRAAQTRHNNHR
jgi:hypothetical protein